MKFCKYCGKQLEDNAVCDCQASAQTTASPQHQQAQTSPYATGAQTAGEGKFVKALKNIPNTLKSYCKNAGTTIENAKNGNDLITSAIFTTIFFIGLIIANCGIYCAVDSMIGGFISTFNFGRILLASLLVTLVVAVLYVLIKFAMVKIFVKQAEAKKVFFDSFIEFSMHSIPVTALLIVSFICSFISLYISMFLFLFIIIFLIIALVSEIKTAVPTTKNPLIFIILSTVFATIGVCIAGYVMVQMFLWCSGASDMMNAANNSMGSASNLLGILG